MSWFGSCTDIEDRKRAEAEVRRTAELLKAVASGTSDAIFVKDRDGKYLFFNEAAARFAGKPVAEVIGSDDTSLFDSASTQLVMDRDRRIMATGAVETAEETLTADGRTYTFLATKAPYRDESGAVVGTIGISVDITQRKLDDQALRENEQRYRALFESCGDAIFVLDFDGQIHSANPTATRISGYSHDELLAMRIQDLDCSSDATQVPERMAGLRSGETIAFEVTHRRKDGSTYPVDVVATPITIGDRRFVLAFDRDVSVRKAAESSLRLTQFSTDRAVDAVFWVAPDGEILYVNDAACRTLGYDRDELVGRTVPDIDPSFPATGWPAHWEEIKRRGSFTFESDHRTKDGRAIRTEITVNYLRHEGREYNCAVMRDVTERRETERERDRLWNNSPDPLCIAGFDGKFKQVNPAWTTTLGWSVDELVGQAWIEFVHPDDREAALAAGARLMAGETLVGFEDRYRTKDGDWRWFSWNAIPLPEQQAVYCFVRDVTREKLLAEQFRQAQKMEAVGRLAGGVAHDFNNLLTVINGYADLLSSQLHAADPRRTSLQMIRSAGEKAARLTSQLLAFGRKAIVEPKHLQLNAVVDAFASMMSPLVGEDIQLVAELSERPLPVLVDPGQLDQLLMNLVVNARDAMPHGGTLRMTTTFIDDRLGIVADSGNLPPGSYARLSVSDTGTGMTHEVQARIFEPFFTTKGVGQGTGLGLATVYGIVQVAGGAIGVDSRPHHGTTFHVWLPLRATAGELDDAIEAPAAPTADAKTVLVVEDENDVRGLVRAVLEMQGYRVLEAPSAAAALEKAAAYLGPIDVLLTDLVMQDFNGRELAERWRMLRPETAVIFMSGHTEDETIRRGLAAPRTAFLAKPFTPDSLAETVRTALEAAKDSG
ncbi:MAG: PAS domain S-box protein [Pirellulales bacterium]